MLFNSYTYLIFLPVVVLLYYIFPSKWRWGVLLLASYIFYGLWNWDYLFLIVGGTLVSYLGALGMEQFHQHKRKIFIACIISSLGVLGVFKYADFALENANLFMEWIGDKRRMSSLDLLLPVGISFYTFQMVGYLIDVYKGRQKAENHLGIYALYVSFFPQLVAGPIERFDHLAPQFKKQHHWSYDHFRRGMILIAYGLFVKMVIADNLAIAVDGFYVNISAYDGWNAVLAVVLYSIQIYGDFYGYSIIAIGSALLMGIDLMDNFKTPYAAASIAEFWQRWHISLSTWFRDYVYFPLGGNKVKWRRWVLNILIVFLLSGLWHGARWNFVIWGGIYALTYILENQVLEYVPFLKAKNGLLKGFGILKTFVIVTLAWIFFRSDSLEQAIAVFEQFKVSQLGKENIELSLEVIVLLVVFIASDVLFFRKRVDHFVTSQNMVVRWSIYAFLIFSIIVFSAMAITPFIYFQF